MGQPELDDSKNVYPGINLHELDGTGRVGSETVPQVGEHVMEGARSDEEIAEHIPDEMPEGGYGWVIVGCMIAMNASTWGEFLSSLLPARQDDRILVGLNNTRR